MNRTASSAATVTEAGLALGVSSSTIWRMIRRGELPSVRRRGRRLVPRAALRGTPPKAGTREIAPLRKDHPIFRLVGAGRSGGNPPGARDKHGILHR
jgi:excisionase family DNA binding protein